jgi:NDP-sugar pyrophosphorylase family protein
MAVTDIREKANEVREERTSSLKSFFSNCFTPPEPTSSENDIDVENDILIQNKTDIDSATYHDITTYSEIDTSSENNIHRDNNMRQENSIDIEKPTRINNNTDIENNTYIEKAINFQNDTYDNNNIHIQNATYQKNDTDSKSDTYSNNNSHIDSDIYTNNETYVDLEQRENKTYSDNETRKYATRGEETTIKKTIHSKNTDVINATHIERATLQNNTPVEDEIQQNDIYIENDIPENNIYVPNAIYNGNTVKLSERLGFTALGVLAVLIDEFPSARGMLNVTQMSKACGVARTTLIAQLRHLEKSGVIRLGPAEKQGRRLDILCIKNTTHSVNDTASSGSSSFNYKNNNYNEDRNGYIQNDIRSENAIYHEKDMYSASNTSSKHNIYINNETYLENNARIDNDIYSDNDICIGEDTQVKNDIYVENNIVKEKISKSKITINIAARELYFTARASGVSVDKLTNQCLQQFLSVKQAKGAKYAVALFNNLLTKSKDNPNAYVIRAIQQGAKPSREDEMRADSISEAGETVFKKIGVDILERDLEAALSNLSLSGFTQEQIRSELDSFTARISE